MQDPKQLLKVFKIILTSNFLGQQMFGFLKYCEHSREIQRGDKELFRNFKASHCFEEERFFFSLSSIFNVLTGILIFLEQRLLICWIYSMLLGFCFRHYPKLILIQEAL